MSDIGVCLLTFNHVNIVASTLDSVLSQTVNDCEIVISDDRSTDGTWEILVDYARRCSRIRLLRPENNLGMAGNANFAVAQMGQKYIALLHHDDIYREDMLAEWAAALDRCEDAGFVFNPYQTHGTTRVDRIAMPSDCVSGGWFLRKRLLRGWGCPVRGTVMMRRSAWAEVGGMRANFGLLADVDLWMRLAKEYKVAYVDKPLIAVRHRRPDYYPKTYSGKEWSWERYRLLLEIHAANTRAAFNASRMSSLRWLWFRIRASTETAKWLSYAIVRHKWPMLRDCTASATNFDLAPLRWYRSAVHWIVHHRLPA